MLRSRIWFQNQDFGASVGAIGMVFRDLSVPTGPGVPLVLVSPWHVAVLRVPWDAHGHGRHALDPLLRAMRDGIIATATVRDDSWTGPQHS